MSVSELQFKKSLARMKDLVFHNLKSDNFMKKSGMQLPLFGDYSSSDWSINQDADKVYQNFDQELIRYSLELMSRIDQEIDTPGFLEANTTEDLTGLPVDFLRAISETEALLAQTGADAEEMNPELWNLNIPSLLFQVLGWLNDLSSLDPMRQAELEPVQKQATKLYKKFIDWVFNFVADRRAAIEQFILHRIAETPFGVSSLYLFEDGEKLMSDLGFSPEFINEIKTKLTVYRDEFKNEEARKLVRQSVMDGDLFCASAALGGYPDSMI